MDYDLSILLLCAQAGVPQPAYSAIRADRIDHEMCTDDDPGPSARDVPAETSRRTRRTRNNDFDGIDDDCRWWDGKSGRKYDP